MLCAALVAVPPLSDCDGKIWCKSVGLSLTIRFKANADLACVRLKSMIVLAREAEMEGKSEFGHDVIYYAVNSNPKPFH